MLRSRQELEQLEEQTLAPYAMRSRDSAGRRYPQPEHALRTAFQRDRDRIIHSAAFRRLEYKTQVFVNHEGDYYRTRLTHTIEAAQITRTVARSLGLNEELAEAVVLAHDLGHPPFGHAGEAALNRLMAPYGGFDHNAQSLRTVDWIEVRYPDFRGLNLSFEVREGIIKHSNFTGREAAREFDLRTLPCLEAQIVDLADEIAYIGHDLDDGLKSELIALEDLGDCALIVQAAGEVHSQYGAAPEHDDRNGRYPLVIRLIDLMVGDLVTYTESQLGERRIDSASAVRNAGSVLAAFSPSMAAKVSQLKAALRERLYRHYRVLRMNKKAERLLSQLFEAYMAEPAQIPPHVVRRMSEAGEPVPRVIADYIAGMTDRFALDEHRKLFEPNERV
jgi:dGTPase